MKYKLKIVFKSEMMKLNKKVKNKKCKN